MNNNQEELNEKLASNKRMMSMKKAHFDQSARFTDQAGKASRERLGREILFLEEERKQIESQLQGK